jgi:hypothetical protein
MEDVRIVTNNIGTTFYVALEMAVHPLDIDCVTVSQEETEDMITLTTTGNIEDFFNAIAEAIANGWYLRNL